MTLNLPASPEIAVAWINAATTPEARAARKQIASGLLYGVSTWDDRRLVVSIQSPCSAEITACKVPKLQEIDYANAERVCVTKNTEDSRTLQDKSRKK